MRRRCRVALGVIITTERTSGTRRKRPAAPLFEDQLFEDQQPPSPAPVVVLQSAPPVKPRGRPRKAVASSEASQTDVAQIEVAQPEAAQAETPPVKRAARGRKAVQVEPAPLEVTQAVPLEVTALADQPRKARAKKTVTAPEMADPNLHDAAPLEVGAAAVAAAVTPRPRRRKILIPAAPELDPIFTEPMVVLQALEPTPTADPTPPKPRARARKADTRAVQPTETAQTEPNERPSSENKLVGDEEPQPKLDEFQPASLEPQTAEAPAKRLVRSRKTAREHVFETQAKLANPLELLLEHLRVNPGGRALRDLEKDVEDALLRRLGGRKGLEDALEELSKLGAVVQLKRHTYAASRDPNAVVGRLTVRPDGWGVLQPDTTGLREMLIPPTALLFAWHGDRVVARESKKNGELYGAIIRVVERKRNVLVGVTEFVRGTLAIRPDDSLLPVVPLLPTSGVLEGARVAALLHYPESSGEDDVYGRVQRVLGERNSLEAERLAARIEFKLEPDFSADALKEAQKVAGVSLKDLQGRVDLRGKRVTAARVAPDAPLEVAVQAEPLGNGNVLIGIHVADVAYFVEAGKALDLAAATRGVSLDLGGERLALLPDTLERAVEFKIGADRLAISVLVEATPDGNVVNYIVRQSVINAKAVLSDGLSAPERKLLERLTAGLREAREATTDEEGAMLQELLLLGNRLAATLMAGIEAPALYRRAPRLGADLEAALERSGGASSAMLQGLYAAHTKPGVLVMGLTPETELTVELTSGLSRYADIVNQRVLTHCLTKLSPRRRALLLEGLPSLADTLNTLEKNARLAQSAVRQYELATQVAPLTFCRGIVTSIDPWGMDFVLENGTQARLALADMDDEYVFSDAPKMLKARSGRVFRIGSIARTTITSNALRPVRLRIAKPNIKENPMSKQKRANGAKATSDIPRRQVVVLHAKPRGEYQRGVRVTARKLYFGEWSRAAFVASDEFGGEIALERPQQTSRPQGQGNRPPQSHNPQRGKPAQNQARGPSTDQNVTIRPTQTPAQREQARASRIAELKRRSEQTLERNAARAVRGPMEGSSGQSMISNPDSPEGTAAAVAPRAEGAPHRRRRRGGRGGNKTPAA